MNVYVTYKSALKEINWVPKKGIQNKRLHTDIEILLNNVYFRIYIHMQDYHLELENLRCKEVFPKSGVL